MSKQTSPSEGARKAAKAIRDAYAFDLLPEAEPNIAYLIDRASGLAECVEAMKLAYVHLTELSEAWQRGVMREGDGGGGTRSNRNVEAHVALRTAISKVTGP